MYSTWVLHKCAFLLSARSDATAHEVVSLSTGLSRLVGALCGFKDRTGSACACRLASAKPDALG